MNRALWTLIAKDLRLHGVPLALAVGGALTACALVTRLAPRGGSVEAFVFNVNMLAPLLLAEWLIARERAVRSFAWLRTLPVGDRTLVAGKFFLAAVVCVLLWTTSSGIFARGVWSPWGTGLALQCSLLVLGALCLAARWLVNWHYAPALALGVFAVPVLLFMTLAGEDTPRRAALIALWNAPYGRGLAAAGLLAVHLSIIWITARRVERADTYELVD